MSELIFSYAKLDGTCHAILGLPHRKARSPWERVQVSARLGYYGKSTACQKREHRHMSMCKV